ncbi:DUF4332 domain-containing protein [Candidatus Bathyarchaeota archaeon]|nr:DUF4332 domain-containing protein [Candidatus Bathyarchaeota archaeon]
MNPLLTIVIFAVILGALLYYLQKKEDVNEEILPSTGEESSDKNVIKVSEYQAQYEEEMNEEALQEEEQSSKEEKESVTESREKEDNDDAVEEDFKDIAELDGVGPKYQELLREAGYNSINKIASADPEVLYEKLLEINEETGITKRPPTLSNVEEWVSSAGSH